MLYWTVVLKVYETSWKDDFGKQFNDWKKQGVLIWHKSLLYVYDGF